MTDTDRLNDSDNFETSMGVQLEAQKRKKYIYGGIAFLLTIILIIVIVVATTSGTSTSSSVPITWPVMIADWDRTQSVDAGWDAMLSSITNYQSLDGVVGGVRWCQTNCDPERSFVDSVGKVTQSAMVIWGPSMNTGSVGNIYDIDDAVGVAKDVLFYTDHAILSGEAATQFALQNGHKRKTLNTSYTNEQYNDWLNQNCSINYWENVKNGDQCLVYGLNEYEQSNETEIDHLNLCGYSVDNAALLDNYNGGTVTGEVSMIGIDENGNMAIATSTNGLRFQIAGRISSAAIPGAGGYIDPNVGGCVATGHGGIITRFAPAMKAVMFMKFGSTVQEAVQLIVNEIESWCDNSIQIIVLCLDKYGQPAIAANSAMGTVNYAYRSAKCDQAVTANQTKPRGSCT